MIKCEKGKVQIEGSEIGILAEFNMIVRALQKGFTKKELQEGFDDAFKSKKEVLDELFELLVEGLGEE